MRHATLEGGSFVRVKHCTDMPSRIGKDAMVYKMTSPDTVALLFGHDRHNQPQNVVCVGPEEWSVNDLDLDTVF